MKTKMLYNSYKYPANSKKSYSKKLNTKAISSQSFGFLMAAIIIGVILLFGGYSVVKLMSNVEQLEDVKFRQNIESKMDSISTKYGSVEVFDLTGLKGYTQVCVFDLEKKTEIVNSWDFNVNNNNLPNSFIMKGDLEFSTANLFLVKDEVQDKFLNEKLRISNENGFLCENVSSQGTVRIKLEGLGREVDFSFIS